jgi:hypothetical protein
MIALFLLALTAQGAFLRQESDCETRKDEANENVLRATEAYYESQKIVENTNSDIDLFSITIETIKHEYEVAQSDLEVLHHLSNENRKRHDEKVEKFEGDGAKMKKVLEMTYKQDDEFVDENKEAVDAIEGYLEEMESDIAALD